MAMLLLIPGIALPTVTGWMIVRLLEYRHPVLISAERWLLGFVGGMTFTMFVTFLLHSAGLIGFTFWGFLSVQLILTGVLASCYIKNRETLNLQRFTFHDHPIVWSHATKIIIFILTLWTLIKIAGGAAMLMGTPAYQDDVFNNWNLRGKVFFETHRLTLTLPMGNETFSSDGVSSYPPTIPMIKTWLALLHGEWHEGLINSIHILWYLATVALVFLFLRRSAGVLWGLVGAYLLTSLPLYLIHGSNAYADVFMSLHILIPLLLLYLTSADEDPSRRLSALKLNAFFTGLLVFTKNEALLLYLPLILLCVIVAVLTDARQKRLSQGHAIHLLFYYLGFLTLILLPWLTFKYLHGLPFGNAKAISDLSIGWQPRVLYALWVNTFFEGNWVFLWPLFIGLTLFRWRRVLQSPLLLLTLFILIVIGEQSILYLFTSLSEEALNQTGLARGLVHLAPVTVFVTTLLLHDTWKHTTSA
ncbi:glycosyltransferase family 39 protein [Candidatus Peregrinibacteria bacterium]|nr:glycosyltransferase family 39 protein [Candidatus Peregrinibacteria bacterium]